MAVYTLPNGSTYNTGLGYFGQTDETVYDFIEQVETANTASITSISGVNPNIPRVTSRTWIETSYDNYNYIRKTQYTYLDTSYVIKTVDEQFLIEGK
mgnify:CR=1 FL=1